MAVFTVIAGVNLNNLKANHNLNSEMTRNDDCYRWRKFK